MKLGPKITEIDTIVGMKLKEYRDNKGLSQSDMGKLIGSSQTRWAKLESGKTSLNIADMYEISEALSVDPHVFFTEVHELKGALESDGWLVKTKLDEGETDLLQGFSSMSKSTLGVFGVLTVPIIGAGIGAFLGSTVSSYLSKKK